MFKQFRGLTANEERVKELVPQLEAKLDGYEVILSKQKYLAGDVRFFSRFPSVSRSRSSCRTDGAAAFLCFFVFLQEVTLADLFHLPHCTIVFEQLGFGGLDKRPNVQR